MIVKHSMTVWGFVWFCCGSRNQMQSFVHPSQLIYHQATTSTLSLTIIYYERNCSPKEHWDHIGYGQQ